MSSNPRRSPPPTALLAVLLAGASPASAADGFYVGAFGGYGGGRSSQTDDGFRPATKSVMQGVTTPPATPPAPPPVVVTDPPPVTTPDPVDTLGVTQRADGSYRLASGVGGALVGYGRDFGRVYVGVEGDFGYAGINGNSTACGGVRDQCGTGIDMQADARVRVGVPYGAFMPFVSGGASFAHERAYDTLFGSRGTAWRPGWTVGAGLDYRFAPGFSIRGEYLHSDYGSAHLFDIVPGVPERVRTTTDVARIGVVYAPSWSLPSLLR